MTYNKKQNELRKIGKMASQTTDNINTDPYPLSPVPLFFLSLLICISCSNNLQKPVSLRDNRAEGNVIVSLGGRARTLLPSQFDASRLYFVLRFKSTTENTELIEYLDCEDSMTMRLYMGFWDIDVWGYASEALAHDTEHDNTAQALVSGMQKNVEVKGMGTITEVSIELIPNVNKLTQDGEGMFRYNISFPQGAEGGLSVYALAGGMLSGEPVETVLFTAQGGDASGELLLPSGFYGVVFSIEYNGNVKVWREIAHIYDYAITPAVFAFNAADFAFDPPGAMGEISFSSVDNNYAYEFLRESGTGGNAASINILVPPGTDLSALCPLFSYTGARISPAPGTPLDFTVPQNFKIYCEDGIAEYEIAVTDTIGSAGLLADYLSHCPANDASSPVPVKVNVDLASDAQAVFSALDSAGRYADLDLSGSYGLGTFPAVSGGGKERVLSLVLPDSVSAIADDAFSGYAQLESISVNSGHASFSSLDGVLYGDAMSALIAFPPAKAAASFAVPEGVVSIGSYAFSGCAGLAEITVPASVNGIWDYAFSSCANLVKVTVLGGIVPGRFPPNAFPGNLQPVYFAEGGGIGTYDRPSAASSEWVNHGIVFRVKNYAEWDAALGYIKGSGDNRVYTIEVDANDGFEIAGSADYSFGANAGLKVTVNGNGSGPLRLSSQGNVKGNVIRVAPNQTLFLNGLDMKGIENNDQPVLYIDCGDCTMTGGSISGNGTSGNGGGVYVDDGNFTMQGDALICGNTAYLEGGGVYVDNGGSFIMENGEISGNNTLGTVPGRCNGGGVCIYHGSSFTMEDGIISGNNSYYAGGVLVSISATFTMIGGSIENNEVTYNGGGVYVWNNSTFIMEGGIISGNIAGDGAGGVCIVDSIFTMNGGEISGNTAVGYSGGVGIYGGTGGTFTMQGGTISGNKATSGGGVRVDYGESCFIFKEGTISYNEAGTYGGGVTVNGTFIMSGGVIYGNKSGNYGGGVHCNGTFTMSGGEIKNNEAGLGGGVNVMPGCTFLMEGGSIYDNKANDNGGGVRVEGSFTMKNNASVNGNTAAAPGGGIFLRGTFNMEGNATIYNNKSQDGGGGIDINTNGFFTMQDNSLIYGNTSYGTIGGATSGVRLYTGTFRISGGAIYGNRETGIDSKGNPLANTLSNEGTALYVRNGFGTAQYGTFDSNGVFTAKGNLGTAADTVEVRDGIPVSYTSVQGVSLVLVPGGSFLFGGNIPVNISGFYMARYEVTENLYRGEVPGRMPAWAVSWYDALVFCNTLSIKEGLNPAYKINGFTDPTNWGTVPTSYISTSPWNSVIMAPGSNGYRLPTEAQWEYAAKGGDGSPGNYTYSGSNDINEVAWYNGNSGGTRHEVGLKTANGLGLYDMSGNLWEWCWDWNGAYSVPPNDPEGPEGGDARIIRGGYFNDPDTGRISTSFSDPSNRFNGLGFRVIRP